MTRGQAEMCAKIGNATADAWLAVKDNPDAEARIYFDTEDDLILSADVFVRMLVENAHDNVFKGAPLLDYAKTKESTERRRQPVIELTNGASVCFLLKAAPPTPEDPRT